MYVCMYVCMYMCVFVTIEKHFLETGKESSDENDGNGNLNIVIGNNTCMYVCTYICNVNL